MISTRHPFQQKYNIEVDKQRPPNLLLMNLKKSLNYHPYFFPSIVLRKIPKTKSITFNKVSWVIQYRELKTQFFVPLCLNFY